MKHRSCGAALVEMLLAALLMAAVASALAGMLLQGSSQSGHLQRKEQGALAMSQVVGQLKNYVTADHSAATQNLAPNACWNLPDIDGNCQPGWALDLGVHDVTFLLPKSHPTDLGQPQYNAHMTYTVTLQRVHGDSIPQVSVHLTWKEL